MTTIAWDGRFLAADGRVTNGDQITTDEDVKIQIEHVHGDKFVAAFAGGVSDSRELLDIAIGEKEYTGALDANIFLIKNDDEIFLCGADDKRYWQGELKFSEAMGSGGNYATAALDLGCTSMRAVEQAIKRDIHSGGKINVYDTKEPDRGVQLHQ